MLRVLCLALALFHLPLFQPPVHEEEQSKTDQRIEKSDHEKKMLQAERIARVGAALPPWVRKQLVDLESEFGIETSERLRSAAWGVGVYRGTRFLWFSYSDMDGVLRLEPSVNFKTEDAWEFATAGVELESTHVSRKTVTTLRTKDKEGEPLPEEKTWRHEYCRIPEKKCDAAAGFKKHFLPALQRVDKRLLTLEVRGRF